MFLFTFVGFTNAYSLVKEKAIITLTVILCKKQREKGKVILTFAIIKIDFSRENTVAFLTLFPSLCHAFCHL